MPPRKNKHPTVMRTMQFYTSEKTTDGVEKSYGYSVGFSDHAGRKEGNVKILENGEIMETKVFKGPTTDKDLEQYLRDRENQLKKLQSFNPPALKQKISNKKILS